MKAQKIDEPASSSDQPLLARRRKFSRPGWLALAALVCTVIALVWLLIPIGLWAYDIERAGRLMEAGLVWPEPQRFDSLPQARDQQALDRALEYLADAIRRRPNHSHAYRLVGRIYAARADWQRSAEVLERARALAPQNPMLGWEASLVYDQMLQAIARAPRASLMATLAAGQIDAPSYPINTTYCHNQRPASCFFGLTSFTIPYADFPDQPDVTMQALFLHPPARLKSALIIPQGDPALSFVFGLDPAARSWGSDGATFRIWVETAHHPPSLAYERTIDGAAATQGWLTGWADLSSWAGQAVTLVLETNAGPAGDTSADWYGWGDLALTTADAARFLTLLPHMRLEQARRSI